MNINDKVDCNRIYGSSSLLNPNIICDVTGECEICGRATSSVKNHICEECKNEIRKLFQEHRESIK